MSKKVIICLAGVAIYLIWYASQPASSVKLVERQDLVEPLTMTIASASAQSVESDNSVLDAELLSGFDAAVLQIEAKQWASAEKSLKSLVQSYPRVQALYVNLAAVLARQGRLEQAREVLLTGLQQDSVSASLYNSLRQVHGALAADAYRKALDSAKTDTQPKAIELEIVASMPTLMRKSAATSVASPKLESAPIPDQPSQLERRLSGEVAALQSQLSAQQREHQAALDALKAQVEQQQRLLDQQADEMVKAQLASSDRAAPSPRSELPPVISAAAVAESASVADLNIGNKLGADAARRDDAAIEQVRGWARAWGASDMSAYIRFYAANYSPGQFVSHQDWLQQNETRFAGNDEITVNVSDFVVSDLGSQFSVTFTQHYRSRTFDETVRKRLVFEVENGDWSRAKIVSEQTVSG
ncbi:L,D-transpeptidase Cds6 family protein [Arenicella xantha]|uniref:Tetratricopeptide repeat protein n=1 Tax=Arenicella xantha TaxID=644221 RepID=A0A395JS49_9GAMM|nr:tetratricopeptide repeat protein [Arenicella xantha]RBP53405.1 tetratricopeptide repeat protein [Arenicella xantha]